MMSCEKRVVGAALAAAALMLANACGRIDATPRGDAADPTAAGAAPRLRVRTLPVERGRLDDVGHVSGVARAFHKTRLTAETAGRVVARRVEPGTAVEEGDVIVELDASRLALALRRAEAMLRARRNDLAHAQREHERGEQLVAQAALSEQRRDDLRHRLESARDQLTLAEVARDTAQRNLADAHIAAPFAGRVEDVEVDVGDYVAPGTPVATLVDLSRARIFAGVTAEEAARIRSGEHARVSFSALGGRSLDAQVRSVSSVADPGDGTYRVELRVEDPERRLRDGLVAEIEMSGANAPERLLAPRVALLRRGGRPEVFVVESEHGGHVARRRSVRTGRSSGDRVEILEGLSEGDRVVVDGHFALSDGARVSVGGER